MANTKITTNVIADDAITSAKLDTNIAIAGTLGVTGNITGTLATAAQTNITSLGTLTTLTVDDITINGSTISDGGALTITSGDDLTIDVVGDIHLDADGGDITFKDGGTLIGKFTNSSSDFVITAGVQDKDLIFKGNDGGSAITALTLDMSAAGKATFNSNVEVGAAVELTTAGKFIQVAGSSSNAWALGSSGGENAPGTASTTFAFHRWNGSAWNNAVEIDTNGIITPDTGTGGIKLGGTGDANKLDDYEEGTYNATISCASGSITLYTSYTALRYTKIGRQVHIHGKLAVNSVSSPTGATNLNLPFVISNDTNRSGQADNIMTGYFNGSAITNGIYPIYGNMVEATSVCRLFVMVIPATNNLGDNYTAQGTDYHINFTYTTD